MNLEKRFLTAKIKTNVLLLVNEVNNFGERSVENSKNGIENKVYQCGRI